jgi:hypothetical protein
MDGLAFLIREPIFILVRHSLGASRNDMATVLFIDTNIWLDFYRANNEAGLSLLKRLKDLSKFILVTDQVEMEFKKNRQKEILSSASNLKPPQGISIPAFLTSDDANALEKSLEEAQKLVEKIKKHLPHMLNDPEANDPVYQICDEVFSKKDHLCYGQSHTDWREIQAAALKRYQLGYPPRKSGDTSMGDAVNWEWIVRCAQLTKSNIAIVSRDGDYGVVHESTVILNDHLKCEFSNRVNKGQTISLYTKLTAVLKQLHVRVTQKEVAEEDRMIENALASGPTTNKQSNYWSNYQGIFDTADYANALLSAPLVQMAQKAAQTHAELEASMKHLSAMMNSPAIQMAQKIAQEQADLKASLRHMLGKGEEEPT